MKIFQMIIVASILLASASVKINASGGFSGGTTLRTETDTIFTLVVATKAQAYQNGMNKLTQLTSISQNKLGLSIRPHSGNPDLMTLHVRKGAFVTVQERMYSSGKIEYVGIVSIEYSYNQLDD